MLSVWAECSRTSGEKSSQLPMRPNPHPRQTSLDHCIGRSLQIFALCFTAIFLSGAETSAQSPTLNDVRNRLPEKITKLTEEQLKTSVPQSYFFRYRAQPEPGLRQWQRVDKDTWHEVYPSGKVSVFRVLGHTTIDGISGTIMINVGNGSEDVFLTKTGHLRLQAFVPDKGSKRMRHFYRNTARGDTEWNDLAAMRKVK